MIVAVENDDPVRRLKHLHSGVSEFEGHATRPTLVARLIEGVMVKRHLAKLLNDLRRLRLQNGIAVIADELPVVPDIPFAPRKVDQIGRASCRERVEM